jgi:hypothetical protein
MRSTATLVLLGVFLALVGAEIAVRSIADELPDPRAWPTPETQIKFTQIEALEASNAGLDVVFIGSSVLESGIDPELLERLSGLTSYNAALPFSSPLGNEIWLRDFVLPRLEPRTVVIGLGVWPNESTAQDDLLALGLRSVEFSASWGLRLELVERRRQLRNWSETLESRRRTQSGLITTRGHQTVYYDKVRPLGGDPHFSASRTADMSADNYAALVRTLEVLQQAGIDVVILIEPIGCPPILEACGEFDLAEHPGRVLAAQYGIPVIDATARDWPTEMYADSAHFNLSGAVAFTELFAAEFAALDDS